MKIVQLKMYAVHSIIFQIFCTGIQNCSRFLKIQYVIAKHLMG